VDALPILIVAIVLVVVLVTRQRRATAEHRRVLEALEPGQEIVTRFGLYGRVTEVHDDYLLLEIAPGTVVKIAKLAVAGRVEPPSSPKSPR
jgi:preprotein translocase subunit YajC